MLILINVNKNKQRTRGKMRPGQGPIHKKNGGFITNLQRAMKMVRAPMQSPTFHPGCVVNNKKMASRSRAHGGFAPRRNMVAARCPHSAYDASCFKLQVLTCTMWRSGSLVAGPCHVSYTCPGYASSRSRSSRSPQRRRRRRLGCSWRQAASIASNAAARRGSGESALNRPGSLAEGSRENPPPRDVDSANNKMSRRWAPFLRDDSCRRLRVAFGVLPS